MWPPCCQAAGHGNDWDPKEMSKKAFLENESEIWVLEKTKDCSVELLTVYFTDVLTFLIVLDSRGFGLRSSFSLTQQWMTFKIVQLHKECPISTGYSDKATNTAQIFSPKINYSDIFSGQKGRLWYIWSLWCGKCLKTKMSLWFVMEIIGKFKEDLTFEEDEEEKVCWRGESGIKMRGKRDKRGRS